MNKEDSGRLAVHQGSILVKAALIAAAYLVAQTIPLPAFGQDARELGRELLGSVIRGTLARSVDREERIKTKRSSDRYNAGQPAFDFAGQTFELVTEEDQWSSWSYRQERNWLAGSLAAIINRLGGQVVWDIEGIRSESSERDYLETDRWVDPETLHPERSIKVARWRLEISALFADRREDFDLSFGRWFKGYDFGFGREIRIAGLIAAVRNKRTGDVLGTYKVLGTASVADRVEADFFGGLFGGRASGRYRADPGQTAGLRAMENALEELEKVLRLKNRPSSRRGLDQPAGEPTATVRPLDP